MAVECAHVRAIFASLLCLWLGVIFTTVKRHILPPCQCLSKHLKLMLTSVSIFVYILLQANEDQGASGSDVASERMKLLERMHQQQKQVHAVIYD